MPQRTPIYQPVTMIHPILKINKEMLRDARRQLENFENVKTTSHVLDDVTVDRSIKAYKQQKQIIKVAQNQCTLWQEKEELSQEQLKEINEIDTTLKELEGIFKQILFLLDTFKKYTIDKIIEQSDIELALNVLTGKSYKS